MIIPSRWLSLCVLFSLSGTGQVSASEITAALDQYVSESKKNTSALVIANHRRKLRQSIMKLAEPAPGARAQGPTDFSKYKAALKEVEQALQQNPTSMYRLAKDLQKDWEVRYGEQLVARQNSTVSKSRYLGAMIALATASRLQPQDVGKYFQVVRYVLPAAGGMTAATVAGAVNQSGVLDKDVPLSPAHLLNLSVPGAPIQSDDDAVQTLSALLSLAAIPAVDFAVKKVGEMGGSVVSRPAPVAVGLTEMVESDPCSAMSKDFLRLMLSGPIGRAAGYSAVKTSAAQTLNPLSLLGVWVLSDAIEAGVDEQYRAKKLENMKKNVLLAQTSLRQAVEKNDRARVLASADALVARVRDLSDALELSKIAALAQYQAAVTAEPDQEPVLRQKLEEKLAILKTSAQKQDTQFQNAMNRYVEIALMHEKGDGTKQANKVLMDKIRAEDKQVLKIQASSHSGLLLLNGAAFLRQWDDPALLEHAESLMEMAAEQMEGSVL